MDNPYEGASFATALDASRKADNNAVALDAIIEKLNEHTLGIRELEALLNVTWISEHHKDV